MAVDVAAGSSYVMAPMTLSLSHGRGSPKNLDSVMTPSSMDTAGTKVNTAVDRMVFFICAVSIPRLFPRL